MNMFCRFSWTSCGIWSISIEHHWVSLEGKAAIQCICCCRSFCLCSIAESYLSRGITFMIFLRGLYSTLFINQFILFHTISIYDMGCLSFTRMWRKLCYKNERDYTTVSRKFHFWIHTQAILISFYVRLLLVWIQRS